MRRPDALASSTSVSNVSCATDDEFLAAFFGGRLGAAEFRHRDDLRLAWLMVRRCGLDGGGDRVVEGIKRLAAAQGVPDRYHETITRFWLRLVGHAVGVRPEIDDFERFLEAFPLLLHGSLPRRHWSEGPLGHGRRAWREPDLAPLP